MEIEPITDTAIKMKAPMAGNSQFLTDVLEGLAAHPKYLHSKYFYDRQGDALFQKIMQLPEYYLTRCELDIFKNKTELLANTVIADGTAFDLIELGAGDATKSKYLLKMLAERELEFTYMPIDISGNILNILTEKLQSEMPDLPVKGLQGEYFSVLHEAATESTRRKVVLFLGGNIGNMEIDECQIFCQKLRANLQQGDMVLIGFDLKKHPQIISDAYNDSAGITAAFNLNLLSRINSELDANFDVSKFEHYQNYDPVSGACRSFLVSLDVQEVTIGLRSIHFEKHECISMEVSQKFSMHDIDKLADAAGFTPSTQITDSKGWFTDVFWIAK